MAKPLRNQIQLVAKRAIGQAAIDSEDFRSLELVLPSLDQQRRCSANLQAQCAAVESLGETLAERTAAVGGLPAVLLREAFADRV